MARSNEIDIPFGVEVAGGKTVEIHLTSIDLNENGTLNADGYILGPDREALEAGAVAFGVQVEAREVELPRTQDDPETGSKTFYFSERTWRAPWQPTGPKPNWQEADPSEPVN